MRTEAEFNAFSGDDEGDEYQALFKTYIATERKLAATQATTLRGVLGKTKRLAENRLWAPDDPTVESRLGLSVLADLNRMVAATTLAWPAEVPDLRRRS